jgi:hypothetical protein
MVKFSTPDQNLIEKKNNLILKKLDIGCNEEKLYDVIPK